MRVTCVFRTCGQTRKMTKRNKYYAEKTRSRTNEHFNGKLDKLNNSIVFTEERIKDSLDREGK